MYITVNSLPPPPLLSLSLILLHCVFLSSQIVLQVLLSHSSLFTVLADNDVDDVDDVDDALLFANGVKTT